MKEKLFEASPKVRIAGALLFFLPVLSLVFPPVCGAGAVQIPKTGQSACYDRAGAVIKCAGTGQDGEKQAGAAWPSPRFSDNANGTITDNLTGLIWLKNANCAGLLTWPSALAWSNKLENGKCGLSDNSAAGDWRLPNINELRSLIDYSRHDPGLPPGNFFSAVQTIWYWSSTTNPAYTRGAFTVSMGRGGVRVIDKLYGAIGSSNVGDKTSDAFGVWPVRDAK